MVGGTTQYFRWKLLHNSDVKLLVMRLKVSIVHKLLADCRPNITSWEEEKIAFSDGK